MNDYTKIRNAIECGVRHLTDDEIDRLIDLLKRMKEI